MTSENVQKPGRAWRTVIFLCRLVVGVAAMPRRAGVAYVLNALAIRSAQEMEGRIAFVSI